MSEAEQEDAPEESRDLRMKEVDDTGTAVQTLQ